MSKSTKAKIIAVLVAIAAAIGMAIKFLGQVPDAPEVVEAPKVEVKAPEAPTVVPEPTPAPAEPVVAPEVIAPTEVMEDDQPTPQ